MDRTIAQTEGGCIVARPFDHILAFTSDLEWDLHSFFTGAEITPKNRQAFYEEITKNVAKKVYPTTDHAFISCLFGWCRVGYVSLDNSVRSNIFGEPLKKRLDALCHAIRGFIESIGEDCILFLSEACRSSFDGGNLEDRLNEMPWSQMRDRICELCGLEYLGECKNNDSEMSFGVAAFCTPSGRKYVEGVRQCRILTEGFGSGCAVVDLVGGQSVYGVQFPLDFTRTGVDNLGHKTMLGLVAEMKGKNAIAIGDFNTLTGPINDTIRAAIPNNMHLLIDDVSYFGSYFDGIKLDKKLPPLL